MKIDFTINSPYTYKNRIVRVGLSIDDVDWTIPWLASGESDPLAFACKVIDGFQQPTEGEQPQ